MSSKTNLRQLKRSRAKLASGDVFAMRLPDGRYIYGRVIQPDLPRGKAPMPTSNLIYIYDPTTTKKTPVPMDSLRPERLLIPPQFVNRSPWTKGYFENVAHEPLEESDLLRQHCFWDAVRKTYRNDVGESIPHRIEHCGDWGLGSYRLIDDLVSDAIGIARALG